ncbi:MAG: hypothetical protein J6P18_02620, partial [Aeriscardovia sp.]|nr:hypothetical protein [Aeriscardovia sp.]
MAQESGERRRRRVVSSTLQPAPEPQQMRQNPQEGGKKGFASIAQSDTFSFMAAVGGWRGIFEAVGP